MVKTSTLSRSKKFFSYYRPYRGLFLADMLCAFVVAAITLILPLCARFITQNVWLLSILVGSPYALFVWRRRRKSNSAL